MKFLNIVLLLALSICLQGCEVKEKYDQPKQELSQSCLLGLAALDDRWKDDAASIASLQSNFKDLPIKTRFDELKSSAVALCGDEQSAAKRIASIEKHFGRWSDITQNHYADKNGSLATYYSTLEKQLKENAPQRLNAGLRTSTLGQDWRPIGPTSPAPMDFPSTRSSNGVGMFTIVRRSGNDKLYAVASRGGLFRSDDGGQSWLKPNPNGLNGTLSGMQIHSLSISNQNPDKLLITLGIEHLGVSHHHSIGLAESDDAGQSWSLIETDFARQSGESIVHAAYDPSNDNKLFFITRSGGEYKPLPQMGWSGFVSTTHCINEDGENEPISTGCPAPKMFDSKVYYSEDGGQSFGANVGSYDNDAPIYSIEDREIRKIAWGEANNRLFLLGDRILVSDGTAPFNFLDITLSLLSINASGVNAYPHAINSRIYSSLTVNPNTKTTYIAALEFPILGNIRDGNLLNPQDFGYRHWITKYTAINGWEDGKVFSNRAPGINPTESQSLYRYDIKVSPNDDNKLYMEGVEAHRSFDGGDNWVQMTNPNPLSNQYVHHDIRDMHVLSGIGGKDIVYLANDGGISASFDGGDKFNDISNHRLDAHQFWGFDMTTNTKLDRIFTGNQDSSGKRRTEDEGYHWLHMTNFPYSDGGTVAISKHNPDKVMSLYNGTLVKTSNGGSTWGSSRRLHSFHNAVIEAHPNEEDTFYFGDSDGQYIAGKWVVSTARISRTRDFAASAFDNLLEPGHTGKLAAISISKSNDDILYAAFERFLWGQADPTGILYKSVDGGNTWTQPLVSNTDPLWGHLKWAPVSDILVHPYDPDTVWLSMYGNGSQKVFKTTDGGVSWAPFVDNLPDGPVNELFFNHEGNDLLLAATDKGIWYRDNNSSGWKEYGSGLPLAIHAHIKINNYNDVIRSGTFGRSAWEICDDISRSSTAGQINVITNTSLIANNNFIYASNRITSNTQVNKDYMVFRAGSQIVLGPGHNVTAGSYARYRISPYSCQ